MVQLTNGFLVGCSSLMVGVSEWGLKTCQKVQGDYNDESWRPLKRNFENPNKMR